MIGRERLLLILASEISDATGADRIKSRAAAEASLATIGLNVISPVLDAMEFDARPLFRERVMNEVRDLLSVDTKDSENLAPHEGMEISDE